MLAWSVLHTCSGKNALETVGRWLVEIARDPISLCLFWHLYVEPLTCKLCFQIYWHYYGHGQTPPEIGSESVGNVRSWCSSHVFLDLLCGSHTGKQRLLLSCLDCVRHLLLWGEKQNHLLLDSFTILESEQRAMIAFCVMRSHILETSHSAIVSSQHSQTCNRNVIHMWGNWIEDLSI